MYRVLSNIQDGAASFDTLFGTVVSSNHIDCDCGHYYYTSLAIQLHVGVARYKTLTSSLTKLWAVILGVSVSTMPRTPSLRSLFLAWLCFSVAFSTVFQAFLTTFLIDSGYKTPIQNMDELFASNIKFAFHKMHIKFLDIGNETEG
jgi:hypothetical protein